MDLGLLALIFAAALLGPALSLLTGGNAPVVVGQLLAGVVLGRTGLHVVDPARADLSLLYEIGFATLMFTVGTHVPLHDARLRAAARSGLVAVALAVPLALGAAALTHLVAGGPVLAKLRDGKPLAPVLLVQRDDGALIIADGYHRVSAAHLQDESAEVPAVEASA